MVYCLLLIYLLILLGQTLTLIAKNIYPSNIKTTISITEMRVNAISSWHLSLER